ncbi:MAG: hypothetical protein ACOC1F_07215, partial [Myxococcota bacterium]
SSAYNGADSDGDKIGNACDGCPTTPNPYGSQTQPNCNIDVESINGSYPYMTDECDPNPCTQTYTMEYEMTAPPGSEGPANLETADVWNLVTYQTGVLPNAHPAAYKYTQPAGTLPPGESPTATVGARFCYCAEGQLFGQEHSARSCHLYGGCDIASKWYQNTTADNNWVIPQLTEVNNDGDWPPSAYGGFFFILPGAEKPGSLAHNTSPTYSAPELVDWSNPSAKVALRVTSLETEIVQPPDPDQGLVGKGVEGVLWSHTRSMTGVPHQEYLPWSNHYNASFFGYPPTDLRVFDGVPEANCGVLCMFACHQCNLLDEIANIVLSRINPVDVRVKAVTNKGPEDITDRLAAPIRAALADSDSTWVNAAEHGGWLRGAAPLFAIVSSDANSIMVARHLNGQVVPMNRALIDDVIPVDTDAMAKLALDEPNNERTGSGMVLSASEKALFVIGGRTSEGAWADTLRVHYAPTGTWGEVAIGGIRPREVLAATYHPANRSLYVIDEKRWFGMRFGRMLRIDLNNFESTLVGVWPRHPAFDRVHLSLGADGSLLVVGSSTLRRKHVALSLDMSAPNHPRVLWGRSGRGSVQIAPTLTARGLNLPVTRDGGVENTFIPSAELLHFGPVHKELGIGSCL